MVEAGVVCLHVCEPRVVVGIDVGHVDKLQALVSQQRETFDDVAGFIGAVR